MQSQNFSARQPQPYQEPRQQQHRNKNNGLNWEHPQTFPDSFNNSEPPIASKGSNSTQNKRPTTANNRRNNNNNYNNISTSINKLNINERNHSLTDNSSDQQTTNNNNNNNNKNNNYNNNNNNKRNNSKASASYGKTQQDPTKYVSTSKNLSRAEILTEQIRKNKYECMVCCGIIKSDKSVWSCNCCFHIFHLYCIKKWATSPSAKIEGN